jgi:hypothetical protein
MIPIPLLMLIYTPSGSARQVSRPRSRTSWRSISLLPLPCEEELCHPCPQIEEVSETLYETPGRAAQCHDTAHGSSESMPVKSDCALHPVKAAGPTGELDMNGTDCRQDTV